MRTGHQWTSQLTTRAPPALPPQLPRAMGSLQQLVTSHQINDKDALLPCIPPLTGTAPSTDTVPMIKCLQHTVSYNWCTATAHEKVKQSACWNGRSSMPCHAIFQSEDEAPQDWPLIESWGSVLGSLHH